MKEIPVRQISERIPDADRRFSIRSLEAILGGKGINDDLHRHNYFFILVIQKGLGKHVIDFVEYPVVDRSVFILRPGQLHQLKLDQECTGFLMQFDADFYSPEKVPARQRFRRVTAKNVCVPEQSRFERLVAILESVYREFTNKEAGFFDAIKSNLDVFFIESLRQSDHPGEKPNAEMSYNQERFEEFRELLETHAESHKSVSEYAEILGVSVYQLNKITKSMAGKTVSELISDQLILESKRRLLGTANQVKDVAYSLGFEDVSYFIRFFKKMVGSSPEVFRNNFK